MANTYFKFKQFTIHQDRCAMKVTTDACLFGAWAARECSALAINSILDIGTGTGLLSMMVAQSIDANIDAIELDEAAAEQAAENVSSSPFRERVKVLQSDILGWPVEKRYDVIMSNPPFYENELASTQAGRNRAHHSSDLGLAQLFEQLRTRLKREGRFFLLLPFKREKEILELLSSYELYPRQIVTVKPSTQHPPFRLMIEGGHVKRESPVHTTISIRKNDQEYTEEFVELLKPYYLYL